jgi:hypothetical protein
LPAEPPTYSTIVLFGKEDQAGVASPDRFERLVDALGAALRVAGCPLKCRGLIEGERGRNLAPRKGDLGGKTIAAWKARLGDGRLKQFEIFDAAWSEEHFPAAYAAINKLWDFGPDGYSERTRHGAESNVTVAIRHDLVAERLGWLPELAVELAPLCSAFYGFVEREVGWDVAKVPGGLRHDLIDLRWQDRTQGDYQRGRYSMEALVPRLYWGNLLSAAHLRDGTPDALPSDAVERVAPVDGGSRWYVGFAGDPQADPDLHRALLPYVNVVPA